jgi:hypothetical protein
MENTMRNVRPLRMLGYGVSLALAVTLAAPGVPNDIGGSHTAFAQGTGQPSPGQPAPGQPGSGDQGAGQTPNQAPGTTTETTSGPGQQSGGQQSPGQSGTGAGPGQQAGSQQSGPRPVTILPDIILPYGGQQGASSDEIDEGDDIGEGLSNQRHDPDD